jgi:hypothetical protein
MCVAWCACCVMRDTYAWCVMRVAWCVMRDACCVMRDACCVSRVAWCVLRVACCVLRVACCVLRVACCVLRVACCVLRVACCVLRVACCVMLNVRVHTSSFWWKKLAQKACKRKRGRPRPAREMRSLFIALIVAFIVGVFANDVQIESVVCRFLL